jgi:hypothetical protein
VVSGMLPPVFKKESSAMTNLEKQMDIHVRLIQSCYASKQLTLRKKQKRKNEESEMPTTKRQEVDHEILDESHITYNVYRNKSGQLVSVTRVCARIRINGKEYAFDRDEVTSRLKPAK